MTRFLQALALVVLGLGVSAVVAGLTLWFAPELRPFVDDPTEDDQTPDNLWVPAKPGETPGQLTPQLAEQPSEVDPQPTLRERMIVVSEPGPEVDPSFWGAGAIVHSRPIGEPVVQMATNDPADDGTAQKVGNTWVHRSCNNAHRDGQPGRICAYCRPRLAGVPTAGGTP